MKKNSPNSVQNLSFWFCFILILLLIVYCLFFKLQFEYVIILLSLFILLPFAPNITEFSLSSFIRIKIGKEVEKLMPDFVRAYKELLRQEFVSNISDDSIELKYMPDVPTIELIYGQENHIPYVEKESFMVEGKKIKIKDEAILVTIKHYVSQSLGGRPIVKYLRKITSNEEI